jgi:polysaccharide export outer membrane protein
MRRDRRFARLTIKLFLVMAIGVPLCMGCAAKPALLVGGEGQIEPPMIKGEGQIEPLMVASVETTQGEQGTKVVIQSSRPFSYSLSNHGEPPRVLVEIPGAQFPFSQQHVRLMRVNEGVVRTIALEERTDQARVEIALEQLVNYEIQREADRLVLSFKNPMTVSQSAERLAQLPQEPAARAGQEWSAAPIAAPPPSKATGRDATSREPAQELKRPAGNTSRERPERLARLPKEPTALVQESGLSNPLEQVIGGTDVLEITVYQEKDLSGMFRVSADGEIAFPMVGNVRLAGLTPPQAQEKLEALLRQGYLKRPQVLVTMKEYHSKGVSVLGAVKKPGAYQLMGGRTTLLDILSMAEGVNLDEGSKSLILVRPNEKGEAKSITIDLDRLLKEGDASLNINVEPNDTVYVSKAETIVVYGEVQKPGTYVLGGKEITVLELLSKAGGLTKFAAPNRTRLIRVVDGKEKSIQVRVGDIIKGEKTRDVMLQPGDMIVVPESYF